MNPTAQSDSRKQALERHVSFLIGLGWVVQDRDEYQASLVKGTTPNHLLHAIMSLFTGGTWLIVWVALIYLRRKRTRRVFVDEMSRVFDEKAPI